LLWEAIDAGTHGIKELSGWSIRFVPVLSQEPGLMLNSPMVGFLPYKADRCLGIASKVKLLGKYKSEPGKVQVTK
jgi:hypothetical protein